MATIPASDGVHLVLLTLDDLRENDRRSLHTFPAGVQPLQHPDGDTVGWSIGEGQDRVLIRWSTVVGDRVDVRLVPDEDRGLIAIYQDGTEYLTTPHYNGALQRHRFRDDQVIAGIGPVDDVAWDFVAGYLDEDHIIAGTRTADEEAIALLTRDPLEVVGTVDMQGSINEWWSLACVGDGRWITVGNEVAELWQRR